MLFRSLTEKKEFEDNSDKLEEDKKESITNKIMLLDLNNMTPMEVFLYVSELQKRAE